MGALGLVVAAPVDYVPSGRGYMDRVQDWPKYLTKRPTERDRERQTHTHISSEREREKES